MVSPKSDPENRPAAPAAGYQEIIEAFSIPVDVANGIGSNMALMVSKDQRNAIETRISIRDALDLATFHR